MTFVVTTPNQVAAGRPPEEYQTETAAEHRARQLLATGHTYAVVYQLDHQGDQQ